MPRGAAATLQSRAQNRITHIGGDIEDRAKLFRLFRRQPFIVDALQTIGMDVAFEHLNVMHRMGEHHHATWRIHDVVIEFRREILPKLDRVFVQALAFFQKIVGTNDRGVTARIAATEPAFFEHRNIAHAMFFGEVIGGA